jgi:hypothetical protein
MPNWDLVMNTPQWHIPKLLLCTVNPTLFDLNLLQCNGQKLILEPARVIGTFSRQSLRDTSEQLELLDKQ